MKRQENRIASPRTVAFRGSRFGNKAILKMTGRETGSKDVEDKANSFSIYNGEFDPGSGRTLAAGLTHASRRGFMKLAS